MWWRCILYIAREGSKITPAIGSFKKDDIKMTALQLGDIAVQGRSRNRWNSAMIEVYDPGNHELVGTVQNAGSEDVEHVLATATNAVTYSTDLLGDIALTPLFQRPR